MTKRALGKFERRPRSLYSTPPRGVVPLLPHLRPSDIIAEPCYGAGDLTRALRAAGHCVAYQSDILTGKDAMTITRGDLGLCNLIVTNPPWDREILHPMVDRFAAMLPTWLLLDADWMHTRQAADHMTRCSRVVSVGRISWLNNGISGFDNCAWYRFESYRVATVFYGR